MIDNVLATWINVDLCVWVDREFSKDCFLSCRYELPLFGSQAAS